MKNNQQLINNIIGQLQAVGRMMEEGKDCREIITQLKAARSATSSLMNRYIEENALSCLDKRQGLKPGDKEEIRNLIKQLTINS
jgi:DNA-binding FrmR family transcriptional regulator